MKARNHTFDFLCGLCILRMIVLHTVSVCGLRGEFWFGKLMAWTFFFMSFFFFKAGYFNKGVVGDFGVYLHDRVKRLLVPYLSWGLIGSVVFFGFVYGVPGLRPMASKLHWEHVYTVSHFWGNPPVWFLFSFFTTYVIIGAVNALRWQRALAVLVPLLPFVSYWLFRQGNPLWMSLSNVPMGVFFFCLGRWYRCRPLHPGVSLALVVLFVVCNRVYHGEYDMSLNKWVQHPWGAGLGTVCALVGISGLLLSLPQKRVPAVNYIGEHSMVYFVLHYPLIHLYRFLRLSFGHSIRGHWDDVILLTVFILCVCTWLVPYVERVPWLSGRFTSGGVSVPGQHRKP
ncbi:MAG: acyltransferase [Bacteroidaceae bacterium]|nr:acyltransferase [Bacteroidaceae bacterium]